MFNTQAEKIKCTKVPIGEIFLTKGELYRKVEDVTADKYMKVRIIDDSGDTALYPKRLFN